MFPFHLSTTSGLKASPFVQGLIAPVGMMGRQLSKRAWRKGRERQRERENAKDKEEEGANESK